MRLTFVETDVFSRRLARLGLEEDLRELQRLLLENPEAGRLDPETGGLRKVRIAAASRRKGKSGGGRVHYLYLSHVDRIYLVFVYSKDEDDTLSPSQKRELAAVVANIKREIRYARSKAAD